MAGLRIPTGIFSPPFLSDLKHCHIYSFRLSTKHNILDVIWPLATDLSATLELQWSIRHYKKDGGCRFYQNALRSEIVQKGELTSFEEQTEHNRLFSTCLKISIH